MSNICSSFFFFHANSYIFLPFYLIFNIASQYIVYSYTEQNHFKVLGKLWRASEVEWCRHLLVFFFFRKKCFNGKIEIKVNAIVLFMLQLLKAFDCKLLNYCLMFIRYFYYYFNKKNIIYTKHLLTEKFCINLHLTDPGSVTHIILTQISVWIALCTR